MDRRKRFFILLPGGHPHPLKIGPLRTSFREAPLTGTLLAALVPAELNFEVTYVDASVSPIPLEGDFDLVAISLITGMALRGYELAAHYRSRGATVVLGGIHVSLLPEEARPHADAIVIGFAEVTWPQLLRDWCAGRLLPEYAKELFTALRPLKKEWGGLVSTKIALDVELLDLMADRDAARHLASQMESNLTRHFQIQ